MNGMGDLKTILERIVKAKGIAVESHDELAEKYAPVIQPEVGLDFGMDGWLEYEGDLHVALANFRACIQCDGSGCKAMPIGEHIPAYYAVDSDKSYYAGRPRFAVRQCLSWRKRKERCLNILSILRQRNKRQEVASWASG